VDANPVFGVILCWLGGLAGASFYIPFRKVRGWSWETYWLAFGFFSWVIVPWLSAALLTNDLLGVLHGVGSSTLLLTYFFGVLFGMGSLTFGLTLRYLGMSLGMALALGNCAVFGTLAPPLFHSQFSQLLSQRSGIVTLGGVVVCILGIVLAAAAGLSKEKELSTEEKQASVKEFNLKLGVVLGIFAGVMSACFAFGLEAGNPINALAVKYGAGNVWQGLPAMAIVLLGSFTTNCVWCVRLSLRNRSYGEYLRIPASAPGTAVSPAPGEPGGIFVNYLFCSIAGVIWYLQFFFYSMGTSELGRYGFSGWTLLMASIIIFSTLWGIAMKEWRGVSAYTTALVTLTLLTLVGSTVIVGYGNYLGTR
jgi:L-rhamnose-H+ transport protein